MNFDLDILIIEPDPSISTYLQETIGSLISGTCHMASNDKPIHQLNALKPGLAILGPSMDENNCLKCIHKLKIIDPAIPVLTHSKECLPTEPSWAPFEGVHYLEPNSDREEISRAIEVSIGHRVEVKLLTEAPVIIGQSRQIKDVRQRLRKVADKDITVLVTGETGTGKELVARSIHFHSARSKEPLVKVDCTSLPDELLESEVFGFQKGAFTDAYRNKPGRLELANGGTLFVDEIGDISLSLQVKFMQVFEDKEFSRLGGTTDKAIDVRVVVATNSDLWKKAQEGTFRKDLFYRLNVMQIGVPPLRERKEDIPLLIHYFVNKYCFEFKKELLGVPTKVSEFFMAYQWPGNIRELENVIRRAIAVSDWNFVFKEMSLEKSDPGEKGDMVSAIDTLVPAQDDDLIILFKEKEFYLKKITKTYVAEAERQAILNALHNTKWNRIKAAKLLGVSYKTIINRIEELDLKP